MSQSAIKELLDAQIRELFDRLEPNENDNLQLITQNIDYTGGFIKPTSDNSVNLFQNSFSSENHSSKEEAKGILENLEASNKSLKIILESLKGIVPESYSKDTSGKNSEYRIEILEFSLRTDVNNYEDTLNHKGEADAGMAKSTSLKEVYTVKLEYNGSKIKENVQILFCNTDSEIPLFTIKHLLPYTKPSFNISIPFDLFFNSQYANLVVAEGDEDLAILEIFPIEIQELTTKSNELQLKIKNNVGVDLNCIIHEEKSGESIEVQLKAGKTDILTSVCKSGVFSVYSANYKRSNIKEI